MVTSNITAPQNKADLKPVTVNRYGTLDELIKILEEQFSRKGEAIVNFNKNFASSGYDHIKNNYSKNFFRLIRP